MPRSYTAEFIKDLDTKTVKDGIQILLAKRCVKAKLNTTLVAKLMNVSRMTVHSWFRGKPMKEDKVPIAQALIKIIDEDLAKGVLPIKDYKSSIEYYKSLTSGPN